MDPFRDLALESAKKIVVLTGAGASVPLGLPSMAGLIAPDLRERLPPELSLVYSMAENWAATGGPSTSVDFELLYTCSQILSELHRDNPVSLAFAEPREGRGFLFKHEGSMVQQDLGKVREQAKRLLDFLKVEVHERVGSVDPTAASVLYSDLFGKLFEFQSGWNEIELFTTNYDRSIEVIWEQGAQGDTLKDVDLIRGFRQLDRNRGLELDLTEFDEPVEPGRRAVKLHKLHGSLHWIRQGQSIIESPSYQYLGSNAVIYPLRKHVIAEPFRSLLTRFEVALNKARILVIIGSSLRDEHLRAIVTQALENRSVLKAVVHDPAAAELVADFGPAFEESFFPAPGEFGTDAGWAELRDRLMEAITYGIL